MFDGLPQVAATEHERTISGMSDDIWYGRLKSAFREEDRGELEDTLGILGGGIVGGGEECLKVK